MINRNNFLILMYDATVYSIFFTLWNVNSVIPIFLDQTGNPGWIIGLASTLKQLCFLVPQLLAAATLYRVNSLVGLIRKVIWIDRSQLFVFLIFLLFTGNKITTVIFFLSFTIFCLGEGFINIPWMEIVSRTVSPRQRGRLFGNVQVISGAASLLAAYIISIIITNQVLPYPIKYLFIFGPGALIMLPSLYFYRFVSEPVRTNIPVSFRWKLPLAQIMCNRNFILMLSVQILIGAGCMGAPFYTVTVKHDFVKLYPFIGTFIFLNIFGGIVGGIIWGYLSDRRGNRLTITITAFLALASSVMFLITQFTDSEILLKALLGLGFFVSGIVSGGWLGFTNYVLEFAPTGERPFYMAINNTAMLPASLLPMAGGFIRTFAGDVELYTITTVFALVAFFLSIRLKEP